MTICSAPNCSNQSSTKRLFRFPRSQKRRLMWEDNCCRENWKANDNSRLCEDHFEPSQFESRRADGRRLLRPNSLPTIFNYGTNAVKFPRHRILAEPYVPPEELPQSSVFHDHGYNSGATKNNPLPTPSVAHDHVYLGCAEEADVTENAIVQPVMEGGPQPKRRKLLTNVQLLNKENLPDDGSGTQSGKCLFFNIHMDCTPPVTSAPVCISAPVLNPVPAGTIAVTPLPHPPQLAEDSSKEKELESENVKLKKEMQKLKQRIWRLEKNLASTRKRTKIHDSCKPFLNPDQLALLALQPVKKWSDETIETALQVRHASGRSGYQMLLKQGFPFPSYSTLCRRLKPKGAEEGGPNDGSASDIELADPECSGIEEAIMEIGAEEEQPMMLVPVDACDMMPAEEEEEQTQPVIIGGGEDVVCSEDQVIETLDEQAVTIVANMEDLPEGVGDEDVYIMHLEEGENFEASLRKMLGLHQRLIVEEDATEEVG